MKNCPSGKITTTLITFLAGFAAAIYGLAPVDRVAEADSGAYFASFTKSDQFALKCGSVLKKWANLAEDAAVSAGAYIKQTAAANENNGSKESIADSELSKN